MTMLENLCVALLCVSVVIVILIFACLSVLRRISSGGVRSGEGYALPSAPAAGPASMVQNSPPFTVETSIASSRSLKLIDVDEPTAAIIMAIVSDTCGIPLSELCFTSIRKK